MGDSDVYRLDPIKLLGQQRSTRSFLKVNNTVSSAIVFKMANDNFFLFSSLLTLLANGRSVTAYYCRLHFVFR